MRAAAEIENDPVAARRWVVGQPTHLADESGSDSGQLGRLETSTGKSRVTTPDRRHLTALSDRRLRDASVLLRSHEVGKPRPLRPNDEDVCPVAAGGQPGDDQRRLPIARQCIEKASNRQSSRRIDDDRRPIKQRLNVLSRLGRIPQ